MKSLRLLFALGLIGLAAAAPAAPADESGFRPVPKITPPISVSAEHAEPALGQPLVIELSIRSGVDTDSATMTLSGDDGLVVTNPPGALDLGALSAGRENEIYTTVTVVPLVGGTSYLGITVTASIRGREQSVVTTVAVRLPEPEVLDAAESTTGKSDSSVRSLHAVEDIH